MTNERSHPLDAQTGARFIYALQKRFSEHYTLSDIAAAFSNCWAADIVKVAEAYREALGSVHEPTREWQPIATAPKDGTHILLGQFLEGGGGGNPEVAFWHGIHQKWCSSRLLNAEGYFSPTHWMPLPTSDPRNALNRTAEPT